MMAENGLQKSSWATASSGTSFQRTQNRKCLSCGISNFSEGNECFRCAHNPKNSINDTTKSHGILPVPLIPQTNGSLAAPSRAKARDSPTCPSSSHRNDVNGLRNTGLGHENGLSTSRWAPRNYHGNTRANKGQVWTRTSQLTPKTYPPPPTALSLDSDLPYQVQHYILAMIQGIIEEGCFDVAQRWIPEALHANRWDCPEAVELSKWRDFLPTNLPSNAIKPLSNYTLDMALGHAVQIRNKAVHRHLCDNNEIRRMAVQAQDLMYMFSDVTRSEKLHYLWVELNNWDSRNGMDPQDARQKLEAALKRISERPVDDMDWTPNAVSLQEITSEFDATQTAQNQPDWEAMDLD